MSDLPNADTTTMDQPTSGNVLDNASLPPGTTAQVTGFSVAGSTQVHPPGSNVTLADPLTGKPVGTITIAPSGTYTFDPVPGFVGPVPTVNVYEQASNGQTAVSALTLVVVPGACPAT